VPSPSTSARDQAPDAGLSPIEGLPPVEVVLDDPRLAAARSLDQEGNETGAAVEVDRVRATTTLDHERACAFGFVAGRMHSAAAEYAESAAAFDAAAGGAGAPCRLAPYARLRQAEALVRAGRGDDALTALRGAGDLAKTDEGQLATADARVVLGDRAAAVAVWRALLAASPHGLRWVDTSMQLARALLDGVDGPAEARAPEALDLATRVVVEAPLVADKVDAAGLRDRASATMQRRPTPPLTLEERTRQAQAWLDASQPKRARELADGVVRAIPPGKAHADLACKASILRAHAMPHGHPDDTADAWGVAITRCRDDDALASALYQGARASANAGRTAEALARFGDVEKRFPAHRLADDARFRAALLVGDHGDLPRSIAMLESIADAYPDGDMGTDALFRVFLEKLQRRDLDAARAIVDRLLSVPPDVLGWGSTCRAEYFRARVAELAGDAESARTRYLAIVNGRPLSYYMLLAYARLHGIDDALARSTLAAAVRAEPAGPFFTRPHPELATPAFARFLALLEVGEVDAARREAAVSGLSADGVDPELLWALAWLYDRAGAPDLGHGFARTRLVDYRVHWPAGRWRVAWEVAFPRAFGDIVARESEATHVPAPLTWAIMREESAFNPEARSAASALGLMQLMSSTARLVAQGTALAWDDDALRRPDVSIALGARLLSSLRGSFAAQPALAIAAYNGGTVAVRRWRNERAGEDFDVFVERIGFDETRNYLKRVLASQATYAFLYAPEALDEVLGLLGSDGEPRPSPPSVAGGSPGAPLAAP
jgi:soluble lytic murein transglycosylase